MAAPRRDSDLSTIQMFINNATLSLQKLDIVNSIILIGSYARGDFSEQSDIDIVVITSQDTQRNTLMRYIESTSLKERLSILPYSSARFVEMYDKGSIFVKHVIGEGRILFDNGFVKELIKKVFPSSYDNALQELELVKERLQFYQDPTIFNNLFSQCLSRIYKLFLQVMIIALVLRNEFEFNKYKGVERFIELYPTLKYDVLSLRKLEPFSILKSNLRNNRLDEFASISSSEVENYITRLRRIIEHVESEYKN